MLIYAIAVGVLMGWLAQSEKGRTGAFWGIAAFFFAMFVYLVTYTVASPEQANTQAVNITASVVTCGVFGLIILTLPKKERS